jgi:hypothetical protein
MSGRAKPRWSAERRASRVMGRKAPRKRLAYRVESAFTRVFDAHDTPHGCLAGTRTSLGAPPTPRFGVSEAKVQTPDAKTRRGNDGGCLYGEMGPQAPVVPAKAGTRDHRRWLWVPALAALGRDDDRSVRAKHQPAAVGNDHGPRSIVSGLLFTMNSATPTCRAVSRATVRTTVR